MKKKKLMTASDMAKESAKVRAELMKDPKYRAKISEKNRKVAIEAWAKRKAKVVHLT
jgi:translation initiation factor 2 alpha subunit (eIF-2alpha)